MAKMLFISKDEKINSSLQNLAKEIECEYLRYGNSEDPLDIVSEIFSINPSLLILDDDFIEPNSAKLLESLKKVSSKLSIIFITSDISIELGRKINNLGVKYYLIKPISEEHLKEFIKSVKTQNEEHIF